MNPQLAPLIIRNPRAAALIGCGGGGGAGGRSISRPGGGGPFKSADTRQFLCSKRARPFFPQPHAHTRGVLRSCGRTERNMNAKHLANLAPRVGKRPNQQKALCCSSVSVSACGAWLEFAIWSSMYMLAGLFPCVPLPLQT